MGTGATHVRRKRTNVKMCHPYYVDSNSYVVFEVGQTEYTEASACIRAIFYRDGFVYDITESKKKELIQREVDKRFGLLIKFDDVPIPELT